MVHSRKRSTWYQGAYLLLAAFLLRLLDLVRSPMSAEFGHIRFSTAPVRLMSFALQNSMTNLQVAVSIYRGPTPFTGDQGQAIESNA